jgi:hypothetical protein
VKPGKFDKTVRYCLFVGEMRPSSLQGNKGSLWSFGIPCGENHSCICRIPHKHSSTGVTLRVPLGIFSNLQLQGYDLNIKTRLLRLVSLALDSLAFLNSAYSFPISCSGPIPITTGRYALFFSDHHADLAFIILHMLNARSVQLLDCQYPKTGTVRL